MDSPRRSGFSLAVVGLLSTTTLVLAAFTLHGWPLTVYTWIFTGLCAASGATRGLPDKRRFLFIPLLLICVYLAVPGLFLFIPGFEMWSLFDDVGGRSGWSFAPGLEFGRDGPNTVLLESYVGELQPNWWKQAPHSPYVRDGNERVQSRNLIRHKYFSEVLEMLPDDEARRTVILALTDKDNRLRVHQGLLLSCLHALDFPAGMDARSWWSQHAFVFRAERDPFIAASLTQGWLEEIERLFSHDWPRTVESHYIAATYQEGGQWGGHSDFGQARLEIHFGDRSADPRAVETSRRILWWPERNPVPTKADQRVKDARTGYYQGSFNAVLAGDIQGFLDAYLRWRVGQKV